LNFGMNVISPETRMMGLPYGEEIMIIGRTMWTQSTSVTDGRTDRITITKTVQRRASHGKNWTVSAKGILKIKGHIFVWPVVKVKKWPEFLPSSSEHF